MARRADWDYDDDDFEILNQTSPIEILDKFDYIENDSFEIVPCRKPPPLLINTNPIQPVTLIANSVPASIKIDTPIVTEVKQSLQNSSPSSTNLSSFPIRYGSAAIIPHTEGFDLQSIITRKPSLPYQTNNLMNILRDDKSKKPVYTDNHLQQLLIDNDHDRQNLVHIAKQVRQDFINAIQLD